MANIAIHSATEMETKEIEVVTKKVVTVPKEVGSVRVYQVQYRNYPHSVHIQGKTEEHNRHYGFAFDIPGQVTEYGDSARKLPSLAGTDEVYYPGALFVNGASATLVGSAHEPRQIELTALPSGV